MLNQVGRERFEQGLRAAIKTCKFFPSIAEIGEAIPHPGVQQTYKPPTLDELREAELAKNSPELREFIDTFERIKHGKAME